MALINSGSDDEDKKPDNDNPFFLKWQDSEERMKICRDCEKFLKTVSICSVCRCYMPAKTKIRYAKCPEGKW